MKSCLTLLCLLMCFGILSACASAVSPATPLPALSPTTAPSRTPNLATAAASPLPAATPTPAQIGSTLDVTYTLSVAPDANSFALDIYAPMAGANLPVVVFLHGTGENRRGYARFSRELAAAGFVVYTADWAVYALGRGAQEQGRGYREALEGAACAVGYARATAAAFGGDARRVTLAGFSAGGGIAALLAFQGDQPESRWTAYESQGGPSRQIACAKPGDSARVDALIGIAGVYGVADTLRSSQPQLADLLAPPGYLEARKDLRVRLLHGTADSIVPLAVSESFASRLQSAGLDVLLTKHAGPHAMPVPLFIETLRTLWY